MAGSARLLSALVPKAIRDILYKSPDYSINFI